MSDLTELRVFTNVTTVAELFALFSENGTVRAITVTGDIRDAITGGQTSVIWGFAYRYNTTGVNYILSSYNTIYTGRAVDDGTFSTRYKYSSTSV